MTGRKRTILSKSVLYRLCAAFSSTHVRSRASQSLRNVARLYCIGVCRSSVLETDSCGTVPGSAKPDGGRVSTRSNGVVYVDRWTCVLYAKVRGWMYSSQSL